MAVIVAVSLHVLISVGLKLQYKYEKSSGWLLLVYAPWFLIKTVAGSVELWIMYVHNFDMEKNAVCTALSFLNFFFFIRRRFYETQLTCTFSLT